MTETAIYLSTTGHLRILKSGHFNFLLTRPQAIVNFASKLKSAGSICNAVEYISNDETASSGTRTSSSSP
ncbi:MAG: hypothetical protein OXE42_13720 [Gammaproteobacteria bacterium]|nr:hypothetical protein [Gammaproteobacteria bacterium]